MSNVIQYSINDNLVTVGFDIDGEEEKLLESLIPTKEEIEKAELEINVISLLQDLEVI